MRRPPEHYRLNRRSGLWLPDGSRTPDRGVQVTVVPGAGSAPAHQYSLAAADGLLAGDAASALWSGGRTAADGVATGDAILDTAVFPAPNLLSGGSFEATDGNGTDTPAGVWDSFTNGGAAKPSGVTRDNTGAHYGAGSYAVKRAYDRTGWAIASVTNASPPVVTITGSPASTWADGRKVGFYSTGSTVLDGVSPNTGITGNPRYLKKLTAATFELYTNVGLTVPCPAPGAGIATGVMYQDDIGASMIYPLAPFVDRVQFKFRFYADAQITGTSGTHKFQIYEGGNAQFGGLYLFNGVLKWWFIEWYDVTSPFLTIATLGSASMPLNQFNTIEVDHWRIGHPSGFPAVGLWLNGSQITSGSMAHGGTFDANGYATAGYRLNGSGSPLPRSTDKLGTVNLLGVLNGAPANFTPGGVWVDDVSISTAGRIGS